MHSSTASKNDYRILVIDDELSMRELLELILSREGYHITTAGDGKTALELIKKNHFDLYLCDIRLGDSSGLDVLRYAKTIDHESVVIMISAFASTETAVEAMNEGAYDFVPKPFDNEELKQAVAKALEYQTLDREKTVLSDELKENLHFGKIVGNSPGMQYIYKMIRQVANTRTSILITGESGTGKELIARAIHDESDRSSFEFVPINCGSIPENLMESELFGHKKGAFTGATSDKKGLFELAHKGTLFLDEIGELSLSLQVKLLRAVQERSYKAVGDTKEKATDLRFISATNKLLQDEVIGGNFREDLYYRLNVIELKAPPLRQRKGDLKALAQHFLEKYSRIMGKEVSKISSYAIELLKKYDFPGNIRELENLMERSVALSTTNILLPDNLALSIHRRRWIEGIKHQRFDLEDVQQGVMLDEILAEIEKAYIDKALDLAVGQQNRGAEYLGISVRSLRYRINKLNIGTKK